MLKLLVIAGAVVLLLWLWFGRGSRREHDPGPGSRKDGAAEDMIRCAHCGVHLPRSEALLDGGLPYCTEAHRVAGPRDTPPR